MHAGKRRAGDLDRFGIIFRPSPRQADLMIVAYAYQQMVPALRSYDQLAEPRWVLVQRLCQRRWLLSLFLFRCGAMLTASCR